MNPGLGAIIGLVGSIGITLVFAGILALTIGKTWRAQSWSETTCTISAARAVIDRDPDGGDTWNVMVTWSYEVDGTNYRIIDGSPEVFGLAYDQDEAEAIAGRYAKTPTAPCYYDPDDPRECKLDRSRPPTSAIAFAVVIGLALIGELLALGMLLIRRRAS